jgi:hypothetical protein
MGPNERKLSQVNDANPDTVSDKETAWDLAVNTIGSMLTELETARSRTSNAWTGRDAEAASAAFKTKHDELEGYRAKMEASALAMQMAAEALRKAQTAFRTLPPVGAAPTGPGPLDAGASDTAAEEHKAKVEDYQADKQAHAAAIEKREEEAGQALAALDSSIMLSRALLTAAAPQGPDPVDHQKPGPDGNKSSDPNGGGPNGGGPNGGPVVGGSTSAGDMIKASGAAFTGGVVLGAKPDGTRGNGIVRADDPIVDGGPGSAGGLEGGDAGASAGSAGAAGGGGLSGLASGAGLLGAGRGALGKLAGRGAAGATASGAPGRTAGMQKGPTLGARAAGASANAASPGASARGAAGAAGQGASGQAAPSNAARGGQSAPGTQGARGGQGAGSRSGAQPGSRGGRGAQGSRDDGDANVKHLVFEDDQWLDDEETTPGVLS